jgi:hypothetical protein
MNLMFRSNNGVVMLESSYIFHVKVHKNENFFVFDLEFCTISLLVMHK